MTDSEETINSIEGIPVRNLWLLMLYASDLFRQIGQDKRAIEDNPDNIPDLVAEILEYQVKRRIKRNLSYGYQSREAILRRVRGRINFLYTVSHQLLAQGTIACRFEELTIDTARNRFVRDALEKISQIEEVPSKLARRCRILAGSLRRMGVTGERPSPKDAAITSFGSHDADERLMVFAAQLAFDLALPTELTGNKQLPLPDRKKNWVYKLYEKAVAGFYEVKLTKDGWSVNAGKRIDWQKSDKTPGIDRILPTMKTDVMLDHKATNRRIVIDTKFNSVITEGYHRKETLRSGYIYQIYAYLRSQEDNEPLAAEASGLLLHPAVGNSVDESVVIQKHKIRFATVDLAADAKTIKDQLLKVIN